MDPLATRPDSARLELAGRGARLLAVILDSVVLGVPAGVIAVTYAETDGISGLVIVFSVLTLTIFLLQIVMLAKLGQTIGKRLVTIRIVGISNGKNGGFVTNVLLRGLVNGLLAIVPIYGLIDVLLIFREDKRCIHDLIAKTHVVRA
jgi:uncharacterized RDD family membrane protein YckC